MQNMLKIKIKNLVKFGRIFWKNSVSVQPNSNSKSSVFGFGSTEVYFQNSVFGSGSTEFKFENSVSGSGLTEFKFENSVSGSGCQNINSFVP